MQHYFTKLASNKSNPRSITSRKEITLLPSLQIKATPKYTNVKATHDKPQPPHPPCTGKKSRRPIHDHHEHRPAKDAMEI